MFAAIDRAGGVLAEACHVDGTASMQLHCDAGLAKREGLSPCGGTTMRRWRL